jgi:hypothetical protein
MIREIHRDKNIHVVNGIRSHGSSVHSPKDNVRLLVSEGSHQKQRLAPCIRKLHLYSPVICMVMGHELVMTASSEGEGSKQTPAFYALSL